MCAYVRHVIILDGHGEDVAADEGGDDEVEVGVEDAVVEALAARAVLEVVGNLARAARRPQRLELALGVREAALLLGLRLAAPVEVVDDDADEHVDHEEAHHQQVDDEEEGHVLVVVLARLHVHAHRVDPVVHRLHPAVLFLVAIQVCKN